MMNIFRSFGGCYLTVSKIVSFEVRHCSTSAPSFWQKIVRYRKQPQVAILPLRGVIQHSPSNVQSGKYINSVTVRSMLSKAEKVRNLKAIVLEISSPGGSATQSDIIRNEIRYMASQKKIPVYAFVEDMAASGGYYIACAADKIFVNRHSIVGSIGVLYATFGLNRFIARYDVDRRVITAGKNKMMYDVFQEESPEARKKMERLLSDVHENFVAVVKEARGDRLKEDKEPLFEGDFWPARKALELGLVDDMYESPDATLKQMFGPLVLAKRLQVKTSFRDRLSALQDNFAPTAWDDERGLQQLLAAFQSSALRQGPKF